MQHTFLMFPRIVGIFDKFARVHTNKCVNFHQKTNLKKKSIVLIKDNPNKYIK